jgi:hypothetical protein
MQPIFKTFRGQEFSRLNASFIFLSFRRNCHVRLDNHHDENVFRSRAFSAPHPKKRRKGGAGQAPEVLNMLTLSLLRKPFSW